MLGTRGVPARYGGFETAVEEIGSRLVARGHDIVVYCRGGDRSPEHLGMRRVNRPAVRHRAMETLSHTALSVAHLITHRTDVAVVFNAANAALLPLLHAARIPVAVHLDGLEWQRAKWGPVGRRYYLASERMAVRWADALIADAVGIQDYYRSRYGVDTHVLSYGAPLVATADPARLDELGLSPGKYHLVVARIEPENHVDVILQGYLASQARLPLVIVGSVPYRSDFESAILQAAATDSRVRVLGALWDQDLLNHLYAGAASYLHGHSVGGTNPSLLRAMGAAAPVIAWDVTFNHEVLGETGSYFARPDDIGPLVEGVEADPESARNRGRAAQDRAAARYRWDDVAVGYEQLCQQLLDGSARRPAVSAPDRPRIRSR